MQIQNEKSPSLSPRKENVKKVNKLKDNSSSFMAVARDDSIEMKNIERKRLKDCILNPIYKQV